MIEQCLTVERVVGGQDPRNHRATVKLAPASQVMRLLQGQDEADRAEI